ncbi:MAG TPA: hypothetical protein V6C97_14305 [Oculatellaceae cyanobacterium]
MCLKASMAGMAPGRKSVRLLKLLKLERSSLDEDEKAELLGIAAAYGQRKLVQELLLDGVQDGHGAIRNAAFANHPTVMLTMADMGSRLQAFLFFAESVQTVLPLA